MNTKCQNGLKNLHHFDATLKFYYILNIIVKSTIVRNNNKTHNCITHFRLFINNKAQCIKMHLVHKLSYIFLYTFILSGYLQQSG